MKVVVLGSVNQDVVCEVERLPGPGETVLSLRSRTNLGGKGSNQAVAAARAGGQVEFVARVGQDADPELRTSLREYGIGLTAMREVPGARTGRAYITVADGENQIVVDPGANFHWELETELGTLAEDGLLGSADVVVAQLEVPVPVVAWAARRAGRFVLNAAPAVPLADELLRRCDPLIVNESELSTFSGATAETSAEAFDQARALCLRGIPSVVATLGAAGSVWARRVDESATVVGTYQPAPQVNAVDSTGAGDAFVGALATALADGSDLGACVAFATAAAAVAVQSPGTHASYPTRDQVVIALAALPPAQRLV
ncbi:ribokinase [Nocardia sp. NBC_00881]|uniref:ribokinase n=1 Tax=Nocardia sp. NBC_00881 TaxID=2975995 RepID=UPI003867AFE0|nr:ribokinase [Nocardia sp. NBC_00881]